MDRRFLPPSFRPSVWSQALSAFAGIVFFTLGLVASWDHGGGWALGIVAGTLVLGMGVAQLRQGT
jgi:hypothetical protein